jgi:hypothetical protein
VRNERDEVCAQRREAAELLDGPPLGFVGANVLHRGRDETPEQREQLDLVPAERVRLRADDRDHPDRAGTRQQRRGDARPEPEAEQLHLLGVAALGHVLPVDRLAAQHVGDQRVLDRAQRSGSEHAVGAAAGSRDDVGDISLGEHDRRAVEGH